MIGFLASPVIVAGSKPLAAASIRVPAFFFLSLILDQLLFIHIILILLCHASLAAPHNVCQVYLQVRDAFLLVTDNFMSNLDL